MRLICTLAILSSMLLGLTGCQGGSTQSSATPSEQARYASPIKEVPKEMGGPGSGPPGAPPGPPPEALKGPTDSSNAPSGN